MHPVSDAFHDAIRAPHRADIKVEVLSDGTVERELSVLSGSVSIGEDAVRRRCSVSLAGDDDLTPGEMGDLLAPNGNELRLWRGVNGELAPLGVFGIADSQVDDSGEAITVSVKGFDRARKVKRARLDEPYVVLSGANYATAIKELIDARVSGLTYSFATTTRTTPLIVLDAGDDPWAAAQDMARAIGHELYFSPAGVCTLRPVPDPAEQPSVFDFYEGENAIVLAVSNLLADEKVYNHVIVAGEPANGGAPVRAEATDDDSLSPTWIGGDYGDVPYFFSSKFIVTQAQAQDVADAILRRVKGTVSKVAFQAIPHPALGLGDVVGVRRDRAKIAGRYIVESITMPLNASGSMQVQTKEKR